MRYHSVFVLFLCFFVKINAVSNGMDSKCIARNNENSMSMDEILRIKSILDTLQLSIPDIARENSDTVLEKTKNALNGYSISKFSTLLDIDSSLLNSILSSDSLFEVFLFELDKLPMEDELTYLLTGGLLECDLFIFPETIFKSFSIKKQLQLQNRYCKNKFFRVSNYIFDIAYYKSIQVSNETCGADTIMMEYSHPAIKYFFNRKDICVSPAIANACALHFSSKVLSNGKQIILINGTAYSIAKRKDGTTILRKED